MPKEIFPSSYECDCGHQSHFFANTIREMKAMSLKRRTKQYLLDSEPEEHKIVFYQGKMVDIICPKQGEQKEAALPKTSDKQKAKRKKAGKGREADRQSVKRRNSGMIQNTFQQKLEALSSFPEVKGETVAEVGKVLEDLSNWE